MQENRKKRALVITILTVLLILTTSWILFYQSKKNEEVSKVHVSLYLRIDCKECYEAFLLYKELKEIYKTNEMVEIEIIISDDKGYGYDALNAYIAADNQSKGEAYLEKLFLDNDEIFESEIIKYAEEISIDVEEFNRLRNAKETFERSKASIDETSKKDIIEFPTVLIQNRIVEFNLSDIKKSIESYLVKNDA